MSNFKIRKWATDTMKKDRKRKCDPTGTKKEEWPKLAVLQSHLLTDFVCVLFKCFKNKVVWLFYIRQHILLQDVSTDFDILL